MNAYVPVPRDLSRVKTKIFLNLTKRQIICFGVAALLGVPSFFLLKAHTSITVAVMAMVVIMLPMFFLALYEKNGYPAEIVLKHFIVSRFMRLKVRPYKTDNYYEAMLRKEKAEKEVERIVRESNRRKKNKRDYKRQKRTVL